jgi:NAD(P)-dependent dehydrogenase (short-subunit alcohol dehydrogenase family)
MNESSFRLDGQVAVVTGAGSGIGRATAIALSEAGAVVVAMDINEEAATATVARLGNQALPVRCDVADADDVARAFDTARRAVGDPTVLVNNAGVVLDGDRGDGPVDLLDLAAWRRTLDVNLTGTLLCTRAALPSMTRQGGGSIVNIASIGGAVVGTANAAYAASKAAVVGLTRSIAVTHAGRGIRANAICPGSVRTPITERSLAGDKLERRVAGIPLRRQAGPSELAHAAVFLATAASSYMSGAVLTVDGGLTISID